MPKHRTYDYDLVYSTYKRLKSYKETGQELNIDPRQVRSIVHVKEGLCRICNEPAIKGCTQCAKHLQYMAKYGKRLRDRYKEIGRCQRCGKNIPDDDNHNHALCPACRAVNTQHSLQYQKKLQQQGQCARCQMPRGNSSSKWYCPKCLNRINQEGFQRRQNYVANGVCAICGRNPIDISRSERLCTHCLDRHNESAQARRSSTEWARISQQVIKRDNHRCRICQQSGNLVVHHIDQSGKSDTPNNDFSNLVALCPHCHGAVHLALNLLAKCNDTKLIHQLLWLL